MKQDASYFEGKEPALVYIAKRLSDALRLETIFAGHNGICSRGLILRIDLFGTIQRVLQSNDGRRGRLSLRLYQLQRRYLRRLTEGTRRFYHRE